MYKIIVLLIVLILNQIKHKKKIEIKELKIRQDAIIKEHLEQGAWKHMMFSKNGRII